MTTVASLPAAGRELDALIAEKVMGFLPGQDFGVTALHDWTDGDNEYNAAICDRCWASMDWTPAERAARERPGPCEVSPRAYSQNITNAWQVVEKLDEKWFVKIERRGDRREEGRYFERWACHLWPGDFETEAETAPLAICLAALAALKAVAP